MFRLLSAVLLCLLASNATAGFGLLYEGSGRLSDRLDNIESPELFDFDLDGYPDLIEEDRYSFRARSIDGTLLWSADLDSTAICSSCDTPDGQVHLDLRGFAQIDPTTRVALVEFRYDDYFLGGSLYAVVFVSLADGSILDTIYDVNPVAVLDLNGDGYHEVIVYEEGPSDSYFVLGYDPAVSNPAAPQKEMWLGQNRPNPFNPRTQIDFELRREGDAVVEIHDVRGRLVLRRALGALQAGPNHFAWDGIDQRGETVASGTYHYTVIADGERQTRTMVLLQ